MAWSRAGVLRDWVGGSIVEKGKAGKDGKESLIIAFIAAYRFTNIIDLSLEIEQRYIPQHQANVFNSPSEVNRYQVRGSLC